ncbi:hypothetical protein [Clostridium perfringens]|uniref:hypothetical protein n=1 Tax=Clostridium perfringens TaxID=1502 RepID=UPI00206B26FA|nr:hypothetical protein [Clostridium perfringens]MDH2474497.1 hypothetical protein [Clostridium perfringens]DAL47112.1 MAG TPA_asm: hypothetical protein [Caudoviricetes sp.]
MEEYKVRKKTFDYINDNIDEVITRYYETYKDNIGFLLYYPMINLEIRFKEAIPNVYNAIPDREKTNWFIKQILKYDIREDMIFSFKEIEFNYFRENIYPQIDRLYSDFRLAREINDSTSIGKCQIEEVSKNKYEITTSLITKAFEGGNQYFHGMHDSEEYLAEIEFSKKPLEYLQKKCVKNENCRAAMREAKKLISDFDKELYNICVQRVDLDTKKMGGKLKSKIINKKETLNNFLGFLFYISVIQLFIYDIELKYTRNSQAINCIKVVDKDWLKNKIHKVSGMNKELIEKYIDYFTFDGKGTIVDFPLIRYRDNIILLPSSIMLNDWQFSVTNGHHAKSIEFIKKEKNISKSIVDMIYNSAEKFDNILVAREYYYEILENRKKLNSDIDVALYDTLSNKILVIECKWKHNHYIEDIDENYIKIQNSLNKIYKEQIYRHKKYLDNNSNNINKLFGENINKDLPEIFYLAVDKRSDFHIEDKHMIAVYSLLTMFNQFSKKNILDMEKLIDKIKNAKTTVEYFMIGEKVEFCIDEKENFIIVSDELYGKYDEYFKKNNY